jgi:flagellar basal-body rod protein FlgB
MTTIFSGLSEMQRGLNFHLERQNLISGNIANVDTPGYAPKELQRTENFTDSEFAMILKKTDTRHMMPVGGDEDAGFKLQEERIEVPGNDLNYVSMDHEMARLNANTLRYKVLGRLMSNQLGILRYAAQNGR